MQDFQNFRNSCSKDKKRSWREADLNFQLRSIHEFVDEGTGNRDNPLEFSFRTTLRSSLEFDLSEDYGPTTRWRWHMDTRDKDNFTWKEPVSSDYDTRFNRIKNMLKQVDPKNSMLNNMLKEEEENLKKSPAHSTEEL